VIRRIAGLAAIATLALAGTAQARTVVVAPQHYGKAIPASWRNLPVTCPAGIPTQTFTVYDQARTHPGDLRRVENAVTLQSLQLRAAWGTPCATWAAGGWNLYLHKDTTSTGGAVGTHSTDCFGPCPANCAGPSCFSEYHLLPRVDVVATDSCTDSDCQRRAPWSVTFSHEIMETLVDPLNLTYATNGAIVRVQWDDPASWGESASGQVVEICDPVWSRDYRLVGVRVSDFTLPAYWTGGPSPRDQTRVLG
jgi:hypothetical protein